MDKLRELRVGLQLEIRVWGLDSSGKPFSSNVTTKEISALGARLKGVTGINKNDTIGVQYRDQKARFRVVWVGEPNTERGGEIGIECIEPGKCIWTAALHDAEETLSDAGRSTQHPLGPTSMVGETWPAHDRRRYPRYQCSGTLELKTADSGMPMSLRIADLSLGGCYGETMSPLSIGTEVQMVLNVGNFIIPVKGVVRTCHTSMGNGIGFTQIEPEDWKKLAALVGQLGGGAVVARPAVQSEFSEALEALVSLLCSKGVLSKAEYMEEIRRKRKV